MAFQLFPSARPANQPAKAAGFPLVGCLPADLPASEVQKLHQSLLG